MKEPTVREIMTEFVQTIPTGSTVTDAAKIMSEVGIGSIVVVQNNKPLGMLTERDIVTKVTSQNLIPSKVPVEKICRTQS